jgi:tetratricopeptide (TPR) repeat protein
MVLHTIRSFISNFQKNSANETFGFHKNYPIPTNDIKGELKYLSSLRCSCNQPFMFHRLGSLVKESNTQQAIDCYELRCRYNTHHYFLYFDLYHNENSQIAPKSLTMDTPDGIGYNFFLPNFDSLTFEQMPSKKSAGPKYLPNDPRVFLEIADILGKGRKFLDGKDYPNAISCFDDVLSLNWRWDQAWFLKLRALMEQGNSDEALCWCKKGVILFSDNMFCSACGELFKKSGNKPL